MPFDARDRRLCNPTANTFSRQVIMRISSGIIRSQVGINLLAGLRLGLAAFSSMVVLTGVLAIGGTSHGLGVLAGLPLQRSITALQALLSVFALSGYAIAAAIRSRDQVLQGLQSEHQLPWPDG